MCKADWTTNPVRESLSRYAEVFTGLLQGPSCALAEVAELEAAMKGGDYQVDEIVGADVVRSYGGEVCTLPLHGRQSTTNILTRLCHE